MLSSIRRFLALNVVLNGHELTELTDGDMAECAKFLDMSVEDTSAYCKAFKEFENKEAAQSAISPVVWTLVNYLRTSDYSFITPGTTQPLFMRDLVMADREGKVEPRVVLTVLSNLIKDITYVKQEKNICMFDGLLLVPYGTTNSDLSHYISTAYGLFLNGPGTTKVKVLALRYNLTPSTYKSITAKTLTSVFDDFVVNGVAPSLWAKTTLMIPDLLPVYKKTGCVMSLSAEQAGSVDWVMTDASGRNGKAVVVPPFEMGNLLAHGVDKLSMVRYRGTGANVSFVYAGGNDET